MWEKLYVSSSFKQLKWSVCWPVRPTIWHLSLPSPTESQRSLPGDSSTCVCVNNITLTSALALRSKVWGLKRLTSLVSTKYASENDTDQNKSEQALIREIYKYSSVFLGCGSLLFCGLWIIFSAVLFGIVMGLGFSGPRLSGRMCWCWSVSKQSVYVYAFG